MITVMRGYAYLETHSKHISHAKLHFVFVFAHKFELSIERYLTRSEKQKGCKAPEIALRG